MTIGLFSALLLASPMAGAEEQYPASDFKPVIIYQDTDYIGSQSQSTAQAADDSETPAANFKPVVIYQDKDYIEKHTQAVTAPAPPQSAVPTTAAQQPAATTASVPAASTQAAPAPVATPGKSAGESEGLLSGSFPIIAIALAVVGFVVWNSKRGGAAQAEHVEFETAPYIGGTEGETGVAKYLRNLGRSAGGAAGKTGVAKYIETIEKTVGDTSGLTGVAKYLKNRDASAT